VIENRKQKAEELEESLATIVRKTRHKPDAT
jgi:hypothetical protein